MVRVHEPPRGAWGHTQGGGICPEGPALNQKRFYFPYKKKFCNFCFRFFFLLNNFFLAKPNIGQHKAPIGWAAAGRVVLVQGPPRGGARARTEGGAICPQGIFPTRNYYEGANIRSCVVIVE